MAYKIATVREALSLYKNVTDGTDLDKLITLAEVNLPNSMLKIKDDWEIEYLPEQCVALAALEVDSKEYPLDLSTSSIGVMDGVVSTGSPTSVTERITLNNSSESGPLYSNTVEYGEEIVDGTSIPVSYTSTTTLSISQSTSLTYPICTVIATLNGKQLTYGISLGYKVYLNGSVWNYGASRTVSTNATIKLEISSINIHGSSYGELNGQLRVWHECNTNKTYTTTNSSIVYTVSDSNGVSKFGCDDEGSLPSTYNTKITNQSLVTNGTVDIHVAKVSGSTFGTNYKYWKIALCDIIPNYDSSTQDYGIKSIGIKNVLEQDSSFKYTNTVSSTLNGSAYGLHSNDSNLTKGIVTSYGIGVCAVTGSISSYSFSDAYTAYSSNQANLGLFLKLDDPGIITPDKYPTGICEMHILLWFQPHQDSSVERIFSLYVTLYYDPQIIGTSLSDITLTYTTTDNTKLSLSNSNVANLTASNHTYSSGVGTMSWTTAPTSIINNSDFKDKTTLKTVELPKKVTSIGSSSFSGCTNLQNVSWSSNMANIGERAFEKTQITIATLDGYWGPTIGNYAFANSGLRVLKVIPGQERCTFGEGCFSECSKLSTVQWGTATDTITNKLPTKIFYKTPLLTSVILHKDLSEIGQSAFEESGIQSILIPAHTEVIKDKAFKNSKLNTLSFTPGNLKTINTEAFYQCQIAQSDGYTSSNLLYLPSTITYIGQRTFSGNVFKALTIPTNLTTLEANAFSSCLKLTNLYWNATKCNNFSYTSNHPFSKSPISSIIFGTNVEKIPNGIMYNFITLTTTPSLPNSLKTIGTEAFSGCTGLTTSVNIPTNVSTMGTKVFYGCSNLLGASISTTQLQELPDQTFENCINMQSVVFSKTSNINTIGRRAFYNCSDLSIVLFSQSVHTIEPEAFKDCYSLTFKTGSYNDTNYNAGNYIFDSVKIIKNKALHNTKWYNDHAATNSGWALMWVNNVFYRMTAKSVASALNAISVDLSRATCVTDDAFGYWDGTFGGGFGYVKDLTLPGNNCLYIGSGAFMGIERVNESGTYSPSSLQYLGASAFEGTQFFSKFIAPPSLTYVGSDVFRNCKKQLTGLDFRNYTGTTIPAGLCDGCSKLDIDDEFWPSTVKIIGDRAFQGIDYMYWSSLPITIEKIGNRAFQNITHSGGYLPIGWANNLTSIGYDAFRGITLTIGDVVAPKLLSVGENAFRGVKISSFKPKRATGTERVSIGPRSFYNCDNLTTVWIPKNCSIGEHAFSSCQNLATVYFEGTQTEWTTLKNKTTGSKPLFDATIYYNQTW